MGEAFGQTVLVLQIQIHVRNHADNLFAGDMLDLTKSWFQDGDISAELIDHKTFDHLPFLFFQQHQGSCQRSEYTAAVDIPDQQHRCVSKLCHPHVDDIVLFEVDFSRASRTFQHNDVVLLIQLVVRLHDFWNQRKFVFIIIPCRHVSQHLAVDDDLRTGVVGRF